MVYKQTYKRTYSRAVRLYKKKRTIKGPRVKGKSIQQDYMNVYLNPFSTATQTPKIPDGSRSHSIGMTLRRTLDVFSDSSVFALTPWYGIMGYVYDNTSDTVQSATWSDDLQAPTSNIWSLDSIEAYRYVSLGMKIKYLNSEDTNQGYFKAWRQKPSTANQVLTTFTNAPAYAPDDEVLKGNLNAIQTDNMKMTNVTTVWDRMKDISQYNFVSHTIDHNHPWVVMPNLNDDMNTIYNPLHDMSFGNVYVATGGTVRDGDLGATYRVDFYGNIEVSYRANSPMKKVMTQSKSITPKELNRYVAIKHKKFLKAAV